MGQTRGSTPLNAFQITATPQGAADYPDGMLDASGKILGTYMHGLFHNDEFRQGFLNNLRRLWKLPDNKGVSAAKEDEYDKLAELVRQNLDIAKVYKIMENGISGFPLLRE
jgi:adenosylcobyric acid synthase